MSNNKLAPMGSASFEDLKKLNEHGAEYWSAREIQPLLGYSQWRRFEDAINRAITSCKQSGNEPSHHFAGAGKPIEGGKGMKKEVKYSDIKNSGRFRTGSLRVILIGKSRRGWVEKVERQEDKVSIKNIVL